MWSDILTGYGIFILEILTILLVIAAIVAMIISAKQRNAAHHGELVVTDLSEEFKETVKHLRDFQLSEEEQLLLRLQWTKNSIRSLTDVLSRYYSLK